MDDALVLCHHSLSERWPDELAVHPRDFAAQVAVLCRLGYRGVTFTELATAPRVRGRCVAVTFDDAFASVLRFAKPVLDDLGWPATIYPVSSFAGSGERLSWDGIDRWEGTPYAAELEGLTWDELRGLADAGWEVGAHTVTHPRLTTVDDARLQRELAGSRSAVEAALRRPCRSVAYPYGDVDARVVAAAAAAGFRTGAALPARWHDDRVLEWPRVGVWRSDRVRRFRVKAAPVTRRARRLLHR